ncbi:hypothetical protein AB1Y20_016423 [Prymnesium parvum]|uniref:GTPase Der n=1 Tax=Prymnesium parvum TaxID=97485 RepID=A0AB34IF49_PRYPA
MNRKLLGQWLGGARRLGASPRRRALSSPPLPLLAIIGAPNVGKSTLFNRLVRGDASYAAFRPLALVSPHAGTTRDRLEAHCSWGGVRFRVMDTGGVLDLPLGAVRGAAAHAVERRMEAQVVCALREAAVAVYVADGLAGVTPVDEGLAKILRRLRRETSLSLILAVNKIDSSGRDGLVYDFWSLGLGEPLAISAIHGHCTGDLLDLVVSALRSKPTPPPRSEEEDAARLIAAPSGEAEGWEEEEEEYDGFDVDDVVDLGPQDMDEKEARARDEAEEKRGVPLALEDEMKLAVIGKPNVGKSSILNRILKEERHVVHEKPGTTRDAVTSSFEWGGLRMLVADTAGIRKESGGGKQREEVDRMAVIRAKQMVKSAQVTMFVFDARETLTMQDKRIVNLAVMHKKSCVLVANKCDLLADHELAALEEKVRTQLPMLKYAPIVRTCALTGEGVDDAISMCVEAARWRRERVVKRRLNELFERAQLLRPLPLVGAVRLRIRYVTQGDTESPSFVFYMNRPDGWRDSDERWMENVIRSQWPFTATPLRLVFRAHGKHRGKQVKAPFTKREKLGMGWSAMQVLKNHKRQKQAEKEAARSKEGEAEV